MFSVLLRQSVNVLVLLCCWFAEAAIAQQSAETKVANVIKSESDSREYRYLTLPNQLRVLLVSDMSAEKSAAALNVNIGSHQNPSARPGLAHLLEHMLFLGTQKYPGAGEYQSFISEHGGVNNAYTDAENTNYFFDVEHSALEAGLDRFAQFFIEPSFDATYLDREKNAVNAEFLATINDDDRRQWDVLRGVFNPEHPASGFSVGNLETLVDAEDHSLREDLLEFYRSNYSANLMTLVVVGKYPLDELQKIVAPRFSLILNQKKSIPNNYPSVFLPQALPATLKVQSVKDVKKLTLVFPVPNDQQQYQVKPWSYLAQIIGSEASGSFFAFLKGLGWASHLEAGTLLSSRNEGLFSVAIELTDEGVKAKDQIVSAFFDYIKVMTARGVSEWRFNEMQQLGAINFRFRERRTAIEIASELSQSMQEYPAQDVLRGATLFGKYDEVLLKKALGYLSKDNVLMVIMMPDFSGELTSAYYHAPFSIAHGIPEIMELKSSYHQRLSLPERNIFIPKNIVLKTPSMLPSQEGGMNRRVPVLLSDTEQMKLWFLQDTHFHSPKAQLNFRFKLPQLNGSLDNSARAQLYVALLADQLNEYAYPARIAGLTFDINAHARGFDINITGYTDKQNLLVNKILVALEQSVFERERFVKIKDALVRQWRNDEKDVPYGVLARKIPRLQFLPFWGGREYLESIQKTSFDQFTLFAADFLRGAKVDALFYGNLYPQDALKLSSLIEHQLLQKFSNRLPQMVKVLRPENKEDKSWLYIYPLEHKDRVVELYIQAQGVTADDSAHMMLINQILAPQFYNQLRTEKQLGYIVDLEPLPLRNIEASFFVVQSPGATTDILQREISSFLDAAAGGLTDSFNANKLSLLSSLREPALSLEDQSERFWQSVLLGDVAFSREQELLIAASKITPASLKQYYEQSFLPKKRRLWLSTEKFESQAEFEVIDNVAEYQQKLQGYLFP
jgi:insulysin